MARRIGAEVINFETEDPVQTLQRLTGGIGPDRVIDAVGVDATGAVDPSAVLSELQGVTDAVDAYRAFDEPRPGWLKVELEPTA